MDVQVFNQERRNSMDYHVMTKELYPHGYLLETRGYFANDKSVSLYLLCSLCQSAGALKTIFLYLQSQDFSYEYPHPGSAYACVRITCFQNGFSVDAQLCTYTALCKSATNSAGQQTYVGN